MEKYQWPDAARVKLETSPATHRRGIEDPSTSATRRLSADTLNTSSDVASPHPKGLCGTKLIETYPQKASRCQTRLFSGLSAQHIEIHIKKKSQRIDLYDYLQKPRGVQKIANRLLDGMDHALCRSCAQNYPQKLWIPRENPIPPRTSTIWTPKRRRKRRPGEPRTLAQSL
jgi:hypothetical protein